jgi:hypothetical protein
VRYAVLLALVLDLIHVKDWQKKKIGIHVNDKNDVTGAFGQAASAAIPTARGRELSLAIARAVLLGIDGRKRSASACRCRCRFRR